MAKSRKNSTPVGNNITSYCSNIYPSRKEVIPAEFSSLVIELEKELNTSIWLLIQNGSNSRFNTIDEAVWSLFVSREDEMVGENISLVINSPGGYAESAYKIARLFRQNCKKFRVVVPKYAKSAATLLSLGADEIIMGKHAELGPLDAQIDGMEREKTVSALDEIQALERLRAFALESIDEAMMLIVQRSGKKIETALPQALHFVSEMMRPLLEQVDVIEYTQMSRVLKVAEEYAVRLLEKNHSQYDAEIIARHLVEYYPEHGFFIDADEAKNISLPITKPTGKVDKLLDEMYHYLTLERPTILGKLRKIEEPK